MASRPATKAKVAAPKVAAKKPGKPVPARAKKPAAKAAAPKKPADTVTLKTVFEQLGEAHGLPKKQAQSLLTDFVATLTRILKNGDRVRMSGLGIIEAALNDTREHLGTLSKAKDRPHVLDDGSRTNSFAVSLLTSWPWQANCAKAPLSAYWV